MALLAQDEVEHRLEELPDWSLVGEAIVRQVKSDDFAGSVGFVNSLTPIAEEMNHHPDLAISWDTVTVTLTTHSAGGLTADDFELAARIDELAQAGGHARG